jgi:uncharacterized protein
MMTGHTQIAVVTGGSTGLGKEIARLLLDRNIPTCIVSRRSEALEAALNEFPENGAMRISFQGDVSNAQDVKRLAFYLQEKNCSAKWLFNNAGQGFFSPLQEITDPQIESMFGANLLGVVLMTREFIEQIISNEGTICNIMSTASLVGKAKETVYCAAKWGARGFTEALRVELKDKPVKVIAVYPGGMNTPFWDTDDLVNPVSFMPPENVAQLITANIFDAVDCQVLDFTIKQLP